MKNYYFSFLMKLAFVAGPLLSCRIGMAQTTNPAPYCYPTATGMSSGTCSFGFGLNIESVKINTLSQTSACYGSGNTDVYRLWSATTTLHAGNKYTMEIVTPQSTSSLSISSGFWIDYDQDSTFDSVELVGAKMGTNNIPGGLTQTFVFTVPCTAKAGTTRLRVRSQGFNLITGGQACNSFSNYGEAWDFVITIVQPSSTTAGFTGPDTVWVKTPAKFVNNNRAGYFQNTWNANNDGTIEALNSLDFTYTWTSAGNKCVKLKSVNCFGKDSVLKCLFVKTPTAKPVAKFNNCVRVLSQYEFIQLFDESTNGPWGWTWAVYDSITYAADGYYPSLSNGDLYDDPWGNGNNEFSRNPEFAFDIPGTYTVTLTAKNDVGSSTVVRKGLIKVLAPAEYYLGYGTYGQKNDNVISGNYGSLYDNGGPNFNYGNLNGIKTRAFLVIEPEASTPVTIRFNQIRLKDIRDTIIIYDDNKRNPSKVLASYTSANNGTTPIVTSTGKKVYIYFSTDSFGVDSGFRAEFFATGYDPGIKGFELMHNVLRAGRPSLFYNRYNNPLTWQYNKKWKVDGVTQNAYENMDTLKYVFSDTVSHTVCLEFSSCDTTFSRCKNLKFDIGIMGKVFRDNNSNCVSNTGEPGIGRMKVSLYDNSNNFLSSRMTAKDGSFDFVEAAGQYKLVVDTVGVPYLVTCPYPGIDTAFTLSSGTPLIDNINFAMECKTGFDIGVKSIAVNGVVFPGRQHELRVVGGDLAKWFGESCANSISGQVKISLTGKATYQNKAVGSLTPSVSSKVFTYSISDFANIDLENDFGLVFRTDTSAKAGDTIVVEVKITPTSGDNDSSNNYKRFVYSVRNSYDPNMKEVYPGNIYPGFKDWLTYTIHFQNTGNAPAYDVKLKDTLDAQLDLSTFQILGSSHDVNTSLTGRVLSFTFKDIMLPDSFSNEKGSHGYMQYRIKPKAGLPIGANIENTAYIYFDFNEPVVTNTTTNKFIKNNYIIIPDPAFVVWLNANFPACMDGNKMDTTCTDLSATSVNVPDLNIATLEGIQYFKNLVSLNCSGNQLQGLPAMHTFASLNCSNNKITSLQGLKVTNTLFCSGNKLTGLPALNSGLLVLDCHDNLMTGLPPLPVKLYKLVCSGNQIDLLPVLPSSLLELVCKDNVITSIPSFPGFLQTLDCSNNLIKCFPEFPSSLTSIAFMNNRFTCIPNYVDVMNTTEKAYPLCKNNDPLGNPNGCQSFTSIKEVSVSLLKVVPNPGSGVFTIELENDAASGCSVEVFNLTGQSVFSAVLEGKSMQIDLSAQPGGIYLVRVNGVEMVLNTFLVKQ